MLWLSVNTGVDLATNTERKRKQEKDQLNGPMDRSVGAGSLWADLRRKLRAAHLARMSKVMKHPDGAEEHDRGP